MSVAIRLSRGGRVHLPYYHISVFNSRTRRDGRPVEELGFYDPKSEKEPVRLDAERTKYWLSVGAKPSATVSKLIKQLGIAIPTPAKKAKSTEKKSTPKKTAAKKTATKKTAKPARKPRTASSKKRGEKAAKSE